MSLGTFNKCCLCLDLRTGSFIIGYLVLVGRVIQLILSCIHLAGINLLLSGHHAMLLFQDLEFFKLLFSFGILISVFELLITLALLNGLHKKIQDQVQMFYVGGFVFAVLRLLILTIILFRYARTMAKMYGAWQWFTFTAELSTHVVYMYFLCAIRSYYFQMRKEEINERWNVFANSLVQLQVNKR